MNIEILKESERFKLIFKLSENLLAGKFLSKIKGDGLEFIDLKEYEVGDDIRKIDWNVSARKNQLFVKEFLEDKDANHYVLFDSSASMSLKEIGSKVLASSLLLSSYFESLNFSIWFFNENNILTNPLSKSKKNLMKYIYNLSNKNLESKGNLEKVLLYVLNYIPKKSIVTIITDEIDLSQKVLTYLAIINRKHKLNYFHIFSSKERELDEGLVSFEDIENEDGEIYDLSFDDILEYQKEFDRTIKNLYENLSKIGIRPYFIDSDEKISTQILKQTEVI